MKIVIEEIRMNVTPQYGAVVVYADRLAHRDMIELRESEGAYTTGTLRHVGELVAKANVIERMVNGEPWYVAVFPKVPPGTYDVIWAVRIPKLDPLLRQTIEETRGITVIGGSVTEVDWRQTTKPKKKKGWW